MSGPFRLPSGGRVDRSRPLSFRFDGRAFTGLKGDTLASALLAQGIHLVGRSFKYHRPRGILGAGAEEPNALVGVGRDEAHYTPNQRATQVELYDGLVAESQNRWPSLAFDLGAVNDFLAPLVPAGFYYKTFFWPASAWKRFYEPRVRAAAGLGRAPSVADPDRYSQRYAHCDVLIVGAGPAGLAAALAATATGARVILCDQETEIGGSLLSETEARIEGLPAARWLEETLARLAAEPRFFILPRTTAFGYFPHNFLALCERLSDHLPTPDPALARERLWQVRAREVVLASGAAERPLVFPGNDRPGIMLADAARSYVNRYAVIPGRKAVIFAAHDDAYGAALALHRAGVAIAAIADLRSAPAGPLIEEVRALGLALYPATAVVGTRGRKRIAEVELARFVDGRIAGARRRLACDLLLISGGWTPAVHLFSQSRGKLRFDHERQAFVPEVSAERERSAGACRGVFGLEAALADGYAAGVAAARTAGREGAPGLRFSVAARSPGEGGFLGAVAAPHKSPWERAFVDFQNDVTTKDIGLAVREGFRSIEHVKRYTTTGMATDQGKTSNMNALGIAAAAMGRPIPEVGLTTFRMPYTPVSFGSFAGPSRGALFDPVRCTPIHERAANAGALFEDVGNWKRARYFPKIGETTEQALGRECRAVRNAVGIFDGSTLGKIEVAGPDAAEFLERITVNALKSLKPGACRYAVMLREDGFIYDDGIIARLAPDRFHMTTTTSGAAGVLAHMEDYLQTEWSDLAVWLTSITEQYAVVAVQGPRAREVIAPLIKGVDLASTSFPPMAVREGTIGGIPCRLFRVSFTGELGYEINVPSDYGAAVWDMVLAAGQPFGITPYGTEAMHVLRAEKGYMIVGQETDGTVTPDDVGLSWMIGKAKADFVGKRSLALKALADPARRQLVGLKTRDPATVLEEGAQIVADPTQKVPMRILGHVTSAYFSAALGHSIALALVGGGRARHGQTLHVPMPDRVIAVEVVSPVFYDAKGTRLDG